MSLEVSEELEASKPVTFEARYHIEGKLEKITEQRFRLAGENVTLLIDVDAPGMAATVREANAGSILFLTSAEKQAKAGFKVVIRVETPTGVLRQ